MAFYLNRSFELFDNPKYKASPMKSLENAFNFFNNLNLVKQIKAYGSSILEKKSNAELRDGPPLTTAEPKNY
jgi:hypothetical protein